MPDQLRVVVALITKENDYQTEQAAAAAEAARQIGITIEILYAENDAVNQAQQLVKLVQEKRPPHGIVVEPVGTEMVQVARAAVNAGIGWAIVNREPDYISGLRQNKTPIFAINIDQEEVGKIQGQQLAALGVEGNVLYIEGPSQSSVAKLRTRGMLSAKPERVQAKMLKGDWTEHSSQASVRSWLGLSTSRQLNVQAVVCQNDAMAMGARKALMDLPDKERQPWLDVPFTGCDGVPRTGQDWVRRGTLRATVITPPTAGLAIENLVKSIRSGSMPPPLTLLSPLSFPELQELSRSRASAHGTSL